MTANLYFNTVTVSEKKTIAIYLLMYTEVNTIIKLTST